MSTPVIVYVLTALAAVVVVLTRWRLGPRDAVSGHARVGRGLLGLHTVAGTAALVLWVAFLVADDTTTLGGSAVGIVALGLWWVTVVAGLMILARWLPSRGRHVSAAAHDRWSGGPGLSVLAHVGLLVGVGVFTWAYSQTLV